MDLPTATDLGEAKLGDPQAHCWEDGASSCWFAPSESEARRSHAPAVPGALAVLEFVELG